MKLSVVIPCYNEAQNIPLIIARLREILEERQDIEVILVNNGSRDNSVAVIKTELEDAGDPRLTAYTVPVNRGYGYGIMSGLAQAHGDVLGWTHADMQTDPKDFLEAFAFFKRNGESKILVKGKRKNRALLETFFTFGMQIVASALLGVMLDDINAQPKLFSRDFFERYLRNLAPDDFSLDLFLLYQAHKHGYKIMSIPVFFAKRKYGEAKGGGSWKTRLKLIRRTFAYIFVLRSRLNSQAT